MKHIIFQKLDLLEKELQDIVDSLEDLSEDKLHDPSYGWSIVQVFEHLNTSESASLAYMKKKMQAGDQMPEFSWMSRVRFQASKLLLQSSIKWKAPSIVSSPANDRSFAAVQESWLGTRRQISDFVEEYPDKWLHNAVYKHPFAGRLDLKSAIESFLYHQRHHRHQIRRIQKTLNLSC